MGFHTLLLFCLVMIMAWPSIWIVLDVSSKSVDILSHLMFEYLGGNCCSFKIESGSVSCSVVSTLCNPVDCSLSDSSVHGILQARILNGLPFPFSRGSSQPRYQSQVSYIEVRFFTIWPPGKLIRLDLSKMCIFHHINILVFLASLY